MNDRSALSRREFLAVASTGLGLAAGCRSMDGVRSPAGPPTGRSAVADSAAGAGADAPELVIDIHQHTNYHGRSDDDLIRHQRALGATLTVLLPAGSKYGLAAGCGGNDTVARIASDHPGEYVFFANELPDLDTARQEIERYLALGAIGIGEQKFPVVCDSPHIEKIATIAREHDVPVLLHFQHEAYNLEFPRFHHILEKFPTVNFIGHAQTWWANIDRRCDPADLYPTGTVTPGGLTDRYLADYPNIYGDLSAGSGLNALTRDEAHARAFLRRHQDKLLFGTDCADSAGAGEECQGAQTLATIRRLVPDADVRAKILSGNARRVILRDAPLPA